MNKVTCNNCKLGIERGIEGHKGKREKGESVEREGEREKRGRREVKVPML
jgi:hypothetical protein